MYSLIYSEDLICFQVIGFVKGSGMMGWINANEMVGKGVLKENKITHYSVKEFKSIDDMNEWILMKVKSSR